MTMKIQYLGTAAAEGIPAIFCKCERCTQARKRGGKNIRTRSQALIDGKLLVDFPADTYYHSLLYGFDLSDIRHILITHTHSDHLYPNDLAMRIPGFSSLGRTEEEKLHFYGAAGAMKKINSYMSGHEFKHDDFIGLHPLTPYAENKVGDYTVIPLEALHDVTSFPFFYIIISPDGKSLLYAHDTNYFSDKVWEYLEKTDIRFNFVSLDCTDANIENRTYIGHMNLNENVNVKNRLTELRRADEKTVFCSNHFSHNGTDVLYEDFSELAKAQGFLTSFDGMTVEF